jgi:hypothetical protein
MDYEIPQNSKVCSVTGRTLGPGDVFYSAVFDTVTGLVRRDFSADHWQGRPDGAIGFWRGRLPQSNGPPAPKPVNTAQLVDLFEQLADDDTPRTRQLRYVLALLLIRRKVLKLQTIDRTAEAEALVLTGPDGKSSRRVADPQLTDEEIERVEAELLALLGPAAAFHATLPLQPAANDVLQPDPKRTPSLVTGDV